MALLSIDDLVEIGKLMDEYNISFDTLTSLGNCLDDINDKLDPN